jgi:hypothetical protein
MSNERWELAALCREPFDTYYGRDEDVKAVLDGGEPVDHEAC